MIIHTLVTFVLSQLSDNDNKCNITEKTDQNWPFVLQLSIVSSFGIGWDMTKPGTIWSGS